MEQKELDQVLEFQKALGEAGGIAWTELYGVKVVDGQTYTVKINVTSRDLTTSRALDGLIDTIKYAEEHYKMYPYIKKTTVAPQVPAPVQKDEFPEIVYTVPAPAPSAPAEPVYVDVENVFNITKMVVTPKAEGKTSVDFWETGRKFKAITLTQEPERLAASLSVVGAWKPEHFKAPAVYEPVKFRIFWANSTKLSDNGKPYKNIVRFEP